MTITQRAPALVLFSALSCFAQPKADTSKTDTFVCGDQPFVRDRKMALVVGVQHYLEESGLHQLLFTESDAQDLAQALSLAKFSYKVIPEHEATQWSIRGRLQRMADCFKEGEGGTLIFSFSGHGGQGADGRHYMATWETNAKHLESSGLAIEDVEKILLGSKASRKIMFLDACRSAAAKDAAEDSLKVWQDHRKVAGIYTIYSSQAGKESFEDGELKHGLFSEYLIQGLKGDQGALSHSGPNAGMITFRSLSDFVAAKVPERVKATKKPEQNPAIGVDGSPDLDFAIAGIPSIRLALVLANYAYSWKCNDPNSPVGAISCPAPPLSSDRDAKNMAAKLSQLGFQIDPAKAVVLNRTTTEMRNAIHEFAAEPRNSDPVLLYYAGAGALLDGEPLLLGTDSVPTEPTLRDRHRFLAAESFKGVGLTEILHELNPSDSPRFGPIVIVLDMCLNSVDRKSAVREAITKAPNVYLLIATRPGHFAMEDDKGGIFTSNLLKLLDEPGVTTEKLREHLEDAMGDQTPFERDNLRVKPFVWAAAP